MYGIAPMFGSGDGNTVDDWLESIEFAGAGGRLGLFEALKEGDGEKEGAAGLNCLRGGAGDADSSFGEDD